MWDQSMLHRSRSSGRDFWWSQLPYGPVLTHISCTKLKIHSAHAEIPIVPKQVSFLVLAIWMRDQSMLHRSRSSGRDFWWNQLSCGPVLTPISCTKLKIRSAHAEIPIVPKQVSFLVLAIWMRDQSMLHRSRNSGRDFWWTQPPVGQFLHQSPVQSSRSVHHMQAVQLFLNKFCFLILCQQFGMWDQFLLHRSRNSGRDFWWNQLPCGPVLTPISCTKLEIHSGYADSPIVPKC